LIDRSTATRRRPRARSRRPGCSGCIRMGDHLGPYARSSGAVPLHDLGRCVLIVAVSPAQGAESDIPSLGATAASSPAAWRWEDRGQTQTAARSEPRYHTATHRYTGRAAALLGRRHPDDELVGPAFDARNRAMLGAFCSPVASHRDDPVRPRRSGAVEGHSPMTRQTKSDETLIVSHLPNHLAFGLGHTFNCNQDKVPSTSSPFSPRESSFRRRRRRRRLVRGGMGKVGPPLALDFSSAGPCSCTPLLSWKEAGSACDASNNG